MPITTLRPFYDALIQVTAHRSVQDLGRVLRPQRTQVLAAAVGLLLAAPIPTFALELGEASIKSGLGQSLLVEIPYRLAADERLTSACIALVPAGRAATALPTYDGVSRISITSTHIEIFGDRRVREPLIGLNVDVHCGTAPRFVRSYRAVRRSTRANADTPFEWHSSSCDDSRDGFCDNGCDHRSDGERPDHESCARGCIAARTRSDRR